MTRLALISDLHSDLSSLEAALAELDRRGVDLIVCCGDVVDLAIPAGSDETIALLRRRGVVVIAGNHDRWVARDERPGERLSGESVEWLRQLGPTWSAEVDGVRVAAWHARPGSDMAGIDERWLEPGEAEALLAEAGAEVLAVGHIHEPALIRARRGLIVRPGALAVETVERPWLLDRASGRFSQGARRTASLALVDLPSLTVEVVLLER